MTSLNELLHPITPAEFHADYDDRKPLHIPAGEGAGKRSLLDWDRFNLLLDQTSIWTAQTLKLVHNGEPIPPEQYCIDVTTQSGRSLRPSPAKVQPLLAIGASLICGDVHELTPELKTVSRALSSTFAGLVGANVYCSFGGVHAFETHFDPHHVFAVQVEGEKTWRLYGNRADSPVDLPTDRVEAQRWFARTRGPLMQEVHMRPGDVLYLPRGWYHDARTAEGASLHVTFSITPLYGRILFRLLESAAMQDPQFRAWLHPAVEDGGRPLQAQLAALGGKLAALAGSVAFRDEIAMAQERLLPRGEPYALPDRMIVTRFQRTGLASPRITGPAAVALDWAMTQPSVALEDMIGQFDFVPEDALRQALAEAERVGALKRI
ncbi:MAG: cupin domain-containing protein [Brevundimonas sp.]|uniref:JmjC domain-containing protein n=1 Tax=Brevundimonas sp. TaxID=1871086 RepID=UPI002489DDC0|nr:cupin domain-containing protein [Brevundimonas sp.]MDI1327339.1 cupin domain-containing protein [Brevundimonas sp.]